MTSLFEPMTGRDLGHVTTWDFLIFLLKRGYLIVKFMVFFDLRTSRSYITAHRPAQSAQINSGYSFGPRDVTKVEHYDRRASTQLRRNFERNAQLYRWSKRPDLVAISACPADRFKVKAVPKLKHGIRLIICFLFNPFNLFIYIKAKIQQTKIAVTKI